MAYNYLPADLPKRLRRAGLKVVELDGWRTRGRPASTGSFDPVGVLWHHTGAYDAMTDAQNDLDYARWMGVVGRSDLPAPLCQLSISAEGVVYVVAAGRANHAGDARPSGSVAGGDGNALYVGVECMNSGKQGWPKPQYEAMVKVGVVLAQLLGTSHRAQRAHRETSLTGKWDPGMLDMDKFRADIADALKRDGWPTVRLDRVKQAARTPAWRLALRPKVLADKRRVVRALRKEGLDNYRQWQRRLGYKGDDANGIPGRESLTRLGDRHGFGVVA